jgi:multisubunit Na+/H+ antiporter MnhF subunit
VNVWLVAATVLLAAIGPCLLVAVRAPIVDALVAVELAGVLATLVLVLLAEGFERSSYWVLPLTASMLTIVGGLVLARFLERWL